MRDVARIELIYGVGAAKAGAHNVAQKGCCAIRARNDQPPDGTAPTNAA